MAGVTEFNSKENLISQIRKRDALLDVPISVLMQKQKMTGKNELGIQEAGIVQLSQGKHLESHRQNNRPPLLKTGKTLHSHRFEGGKVDTVLTRQGEISLDSGNLKIPCGGFPAIEVTNYKKLNKRNIEYFWHKVDNAVKRHNILKSMGIADNCNTYPSAGLFHNILRTPVAIL
jgi:hypothetical protein